MATVAFSASNDCDTKSATASIFACPCPGSCKAQLKMFSRGFWQGPNGCNRYVCNSTCTGSPTNCNLADLVSRCSSTSLCNCIASGNSCWSQLSALYLNINCAGTPAVQLIKANLPTACSYLRSVGTGPTITPQQIFDASLQLAQQNTSSCSTVTGCLGSNLLSLTDVDAPCPSFVPSSGC